MGFVEVALLISSVLAIGLLGYWLLTRRPKEDDRTAKYDELLTKHALVNAEYEKLKVDSEQVKVALDKAIVMIGKITNQKKSSEVRVGLITEQLAPFLKEFPYDPRNAYFIGRPIDLIVFDEQGVHFIEVKSGNSRLTEVQRRIKEDVENNRITFEVFRVNGE